jgi:branched-chain amino acid transport system ATP-binding protein
MSEAILETQEITKAFGGLTAVDRVSVTVEAGEITGLIGPNGAGKSTLFNLMSGFYEADDGTVRFDGEDVTDLRPEKRATRGLIRTFQLTRELAGMTVMDNMLLGAQGNPGESVLSLLTDPGSVREFEDAQHDRAEELLRYLELWDLREEYAGNLSGGQRKLLELGRSLMSDPEVLLLDEPMAGVNPDLTDHLLDRITALRDEEGKTFLVVEHDIQTIMDISDTVVGMHNGQVLTVGSPEEVQQDDQLLEAYLGGGPV